MRPEKIAEHIRTAFPDEVIESVGFRGQVSVMVKKNRIKEMLLFLRDEPELSFDYLADLCGVDNLGRRETRFQVVYQLYSIKFGHRIRIKADVPIDDCIIDSVTEVWKGANWHERECFDMFGIVFKGHPDMRRILLPEDWEGHPLRKDYPAEGTEEKWKGFAEVLEKAEKFKGLELKEMKHEERPDGKIV